MASKMVRSFWFWLFAVTAARLLVLVFADGDLGPDEAQYWTWAQEPAAGYFSKPPMIAWLIAATTGVFGDSEWAVRLAAPLLHAGAASFIYLTARLVFDARIGFWAGIGWLALPGVAVSSFVITTDAPLLFFWSAALFFLMRILKAPTPRGTDFAALGAALGAGLLSKYAMLYFPVALAAAMALSPAARRAFARPGMIAAALIAAVIFAPNIAWNAANDFQTVSHTAANANWTSFPFKPLAFLSFALAQFAVFGPIAFAALIAAAAAALARPRIDAPRLVLAVFTATPFLIVSGQALISRAHANWAAAAFPAAIILVTAFLLQENRVRIARASLGLNAAIAAILAVAVTQFALIDAVGAGRAVETLRGWKDMTEAIDEQARTKDYDVVLFDDRSMIAEMFYYQRERDYEIAALDPNSGVDHHYEAFTPFRADAHRNALFVSILPTDAHVNYRFGRIERVGDASGRVGPGATRIFTLFEISDYGRPKQD
ncbi:MAG: glycosyltransferase family 39 protein [Pseudomonadota bacterium]